MEKEGKGTLRKEGKQASNKAIVKVEGGKYNNQEWNVEAKTGIKGMNIVT